MPEPDEIAAQLRTIGRDLFAGVECDVRHDRVVVYARLDATPNLEHALRESERLLTNVLDRLDTQHWIAAVHWSERMCRTIAAGGSRLGETPSEHAPGGNSSDRSRGMLLLPRPDGS